MTDNRAAVSTAIRERLIELRMRPYQLAELTALSSPAIRQILNQPEKHHPTRKTLKLISEALGWPPKYLESVLNGRPPEGASEQVTNTEAWLSILEARTGAQEQLLHKVIAALDQHIDDFAITVYETGSVVGSSSRPPNSPCSLTGRSHDRAAIRPRRLPDHPS